MKKIFLATIPVLIFLGAIFLAWLMDGQTLPTIDLDIFALPWSFISTSSASVQMLAIANALLFFVYGLYLAIKLQYPKYFLLVGVPMLWIVSAFIVSFIRFAH